MPPAALLAASLVAAANDTAPPQNSVEIAPGVYMPQINLGTWQTMNTKPSNPSIGVPDWLSAGGTGIDCALDYQNQAAVKKAIKASGVPRSKLFITTKICGPASGACVSAASALSQVKKDVSQLGVKAVDLVLLHDPSLTSNAQIWKGMEQALSQGLTKAIGVSNFNANQLGTLLKTAKVKPAVNQCSFGVTHQDASTIAYCQANGIVYESYGSIKNCNMNDRNVAAIAAAHGKTPAQVCLRYVLDRGAVLAVGTGTNAAKAKQYTRDDLDILTFQLTAAEVAQLRGGAPAPPAPPAASLFTCSGSVCVAGPSGVPLQTCQLACG